MENVVTDAGSDADCIFPDDSRCGSWDFLSGRCGQSFSYCAQNGGMLQEGANIGTCVFPDGSSCSEFDFFEGRCQPGEGAGAEVEEAEPVGTDAGSSEIDVTPVEPVGEPIVEQAVVGWFGYVMSLPDGAQFDDKLVLHPAGAGAVGISGATDAIEAEIMALRDKTDPGKNAHFWGRLVCGVPDVSGCQLKVERLRVDGPGEFFEPDTVAGWEGSIAGLSYDEPGAPQPDDAFIPVGDYPVQYGIDSAMSEETGERDLADVIASLRDSGRMVRIWGEMTCGVPDAGGCHIEVHRIEDGVEVYQITPMEWVR
jgi:putative hemolysin